MVSCERILWSHTRGYYGLLMEDTICSVADGKFGGVECSVRAVYSRPLRVLLLSDIEQISLRRPLMNLQVFLSLWQETCRFS